MLITLFYYIILYVFLVKRFKFAGRVIGYAIIQGQLLDVFFARHFYKAMLNKWVSVLLFLVIISYY